MKKLLFTFLLLTHPLHAAITFIAHEGDKVLTSEGPLKPRHAPCSTFKIAIALMGYDAGILKDEKTPKWPYKKGYTDYLERWKQDHNPTLWLKNSCVWYSQIITGKLGAQKFNAYLKKLDYGNMLSKNHLNCWLSSTLKIAPGEQIVFLKKLLSDKHPVSKYAHILTRKIMYLDRIEGWKLFGKTGSGHQDHNKDHQLGWFVGWVEKGDRKIVFASLIVDDEPQKEFASYRAKAAAIKRLKGLIK